MSLEEKLSSNQASWGLELLNQKQAVPTSLVGVRNGAAVLSVVLTNSRLNEGVVDEAARAGAGALRESGVESIIVAFDTTIAELTGGARRALVVVSREESHILPVWEGSAFFLGAKKLGEGHSLVGELETFTLEKSVKSWRELSMRFDNRLLDMEARFG